MIRTFFLLIFAEYHVFCNWILVRHLAEGNKKANLGKKSKKHFRKPFLDLECPNFAESISRLIHSYCKITFFYSENRPNLLFLLWQKVSNTPEKSLICHNRKNIRAYNNKLRHNYDITNFKSKYRN